MIGIKYKEMAPQASYVLTKHFFLKAEPLLKSAKRMNKKARIWTA